MDDLPGGLSAVYQLHTLSVDVAASIVHPDNTDGPATWHNFTLPAFAAARRQISATTAESFQSPHAQLLPPPPTAVDKRRARQAAFRTARNMREAAPLAAGATSPIPTVSQADLSTESSEDESNMRKTPSESTSTTVSSSRTPAALSGSLRKRGRKTGLFVRRYFVLKGCTLYNFRARGAQHRATWKLGLTGAEVGVHLPTLRIVVCLAQERRLVLVASSVKQAEVWGGALARAADSVSRFESRSARGVGGSLDVVKAEGMEEVVVDMGRVKDTSEWDSFKSLSALHMRTTWKEGAGE